MRRRETDRQTDSDRHRHRHRDRQTDREFKLKEEKCNTLSDAEGLL